jgi:MerR family mercuric resistance operon transcriptional regulator
MRCLLLALQRLVYSIPVLKYGVNMPERCTIGTLARQVGVNVETIRYYQRRGLVPEPAKPFGGIRHYEQAHARRLRFIKEAQRLGFSLDEVGELLSLEDGLHCREVEEIAGHKLAIVRERIAQLAKIEKLLAVLVGRCHGNRGKLRCPLIASLESVTA